VSARRAVILQHMPTEGPERVAGMRVSANFFRLLGVAPAFGRDFNADEDTPAGRRVNRHPGRRFTRKGYGERPPSDDDQTGPA